MTHIVYKVEMSWYDEDSDSGSVTVLYTDEPTIEEISRNIRIPKVLDESLDKRVSEIVELDEERERHHLHISESSMQFSITIEKVQLIDNKDENDDETCEDCEEM